MSLLRHSLLLASVTGFLLGAFAMGLVGFTTMLSFGLNLQPPVGLAGIAGAVAAMALASLKMRRQATGAVATFIAVLMILTFAQPFGAPLQDGGIVIQLLAVLLLAAAVAWACKHCLAGMPSGRLGRYIFERHLLRMFKVMGLAFFTLMVALPFFVLLMTSFKSQQSLLVNPLDYSLDFSKGIDGLLRSYRELFVDYDFGRFLLITAVVSLATVFLTLLFSVPGAYAVARLEFKGRKALARSILLIYLVPGIVLVIPLYAVFSQLGLRDTLLGLVIVYPATTIPVALYMLQGYFRSLHVELEEAGLMDGLSRLAVITKITLPLAAPALASVSLYVLMIAWNEFLFAFMFLDSPELFTLSRGLVSLNNSEVPRQHLMAGAVIATVPVLALFLWAERYLVQGMTAGGVKG